MTRAVVDACVLYSAFLRDLMMRLTARFAFQPVWSEEIHDEWIRNLLENRPDLTRDQLAHTQSLMDRHGRDCLAPDFHHLIETLTLPDPNDRHVFAAAITSRSSIIVTYNLADFPPRMLAPYEIEAQHPDVFLSALFQNSPEQFREAVHDLLAALKNPPVTLKNRLGLMRKLDLKRTAHLIERAKIANPDWV